MEKRILTVYRWLLPLFGLMLLLQLGLAVLTLLNQADVKGVESNVLRVVQKIRIQNSTLYSNPAIAPFDINQYSPLYAVLGDGVVTALQIPADEQLPIRYALRGLSALLLLLALTGFYLYLKRRVGLPGLESLVLTAFFWVCTYPWEQLARPDVLQLLIFVLLLHTVPDTRKKSPFSRTLLFGLLLAMGITAKLNAVFFIPAFGLYFLWKKAYRTSFYVAIGFIAGLLLCWGILQILGYGSDFYRLNLLGGINNGLTLTAWTRSISGFMLHQFSWCSIAFLIIFVASTKKEKEQHPAFAQLIIVAMVLFILNGLGAAKVGAGEHYFMEACLTVLVLLALVMKSYAVHWRKGVWSLLLLAGLSNSFINLRTYGYDLYREKNGGQPALSLEYWKEVDAVRAYLIPKLQGTWFFSFNREINLSMPQHCTLFASDVHDLAYERSVYDYSKWQKMATDGSIRYVITHTSPGKVYGANLDSCFKLEKQIGRFRIFKSRNK